MRRRERLFTGSIRGAGAGSPTWSGCVCNTTVSTIRPAATQDIDYWRFIPSASLAYTFNRGKGDNLNLDIYRYGGSLPDPAQLSPLPVRISENSYYVGNPRLEPYTGFCADLTYTHRGRWTFAYGFDRAQHMSQNLTTLPSDDSGLSIVSPVNLGLSLTHSLSVGVNYR